MIPWWWLPIAFGAGGMIAAIIMVFWFAFTRGSSFQ